MLSKKDNTHFNRDKTIYILTFHLESTYELRYVNKGIEEP